MTVAIGLAAFAAPRPASAQSGTWVSGTSGTWITGANWIGSIIPGSTTATNSTDIATFGGTLSAARTVTVDTNRNIGGITFANGANSTTNIYTLSGGNLLLSTGGTIQLIGAGAANNVISSAIALQGNGGTATFTNDTASASNYLTIGAITGVSTGGNTTTLTLSGSNTGANVISGSIGDGSGGGKLAIVKNGSGVWRLSGSNTFTGGITLNTGTLYLGSNNAIGTGTFTINAGTTIDAPNNVVIATATPMAWNGDFTLNSAGNNNSLGSGAVTLGASRIVTVSTGDNWTVGGIISGAGFGITKAGPGTLTLTGLSTYTGPTVINGGLVIVNSLANGGVASPLGASNNAAANLVIDSGTLQLNTGSSSTDRLFTIGPGGATLNSNITSMSFTNSGAIAFSGSGSRTLTLTEGNRTGSLAASIGDPTGGTTSIVKLGGSTDSSGWTLSGNNSYSGETTLGEWGTLTSAHANALGNTSKINFKNTGGFSSATILAFTVAPTQDYSTVFSTAANQMYRISIGASVSTTFAANLTSVGGAFEKLGTGTLTLTGSNTFTRAGIAGTLQIGRAEALGTGTVSIGDTAALASTAATPITVANAISGTGGQGRITFGSTGATGDLIFTGPMALTNNNSVFGMTLAGLTSVDIQGPISGSGTGTYGLAIGTGRSLRLGGDNSGWATNKSATSGTLILGHRNALGTGTMSINGVTLRASTDLSGANAIGNMVVMSNDSSVSGSNSIQVAGNVTLSVAGNRTLTSSIAGGSLIISGTSFLQESGTGVGRIPVLAGTGNTVFSGPIVNGGTAGSSGLSITNTGLTTLSGANTYTGNTTVSGGVVLLSTTAAVTGTAARPYTVNAAGALGAGFALDQTLLGRVVNTSAGAVALGANSSNNLDFSSVGANFTVASLGAVVGGTWAYTGTLTPNGTAYRLGGGGGTLDFQSLLSGGNTLTVGGNTAGRGGVVILSNAANSFSGKTTVALGTLEFASIADVSGGNSSLGAPTTTANGTIDLGSGATSATLRYIGSGSSSSNRTINLSGSAGGATIEAAGAGPLVLTGSVSAATGSKTLTLTGTSIAANAIASIGDPTSPGSLSVVKEGIGVWWLTGTSTFSGGLTVKNGTVVAAANANASGNSGVFGLQSPVVGDTAPSATGTAALLVAANFSVDRDITVASGTGVSQAVLIGAASSSGTATFTSNKNLNIGRDVSLVAADGGVLNFGQTWMAGSGSGTPTASVAIGANGYAGTVRLTASGTLATTGAVAVRFGTALIPSTSTTLDGAGTLTIDSGATLGGIGTVAAPLGGAGLVAPGNSPGILSAEAFDPTGGLDVAFEFTGLTPTYSGTANVNDILRLTGASPFVSGSLSAANVVSLYLPANVASGDVFTGGFFTDLSSSSFSTFLSSVTSGNFVAYYLDSSGSFAYGGNMYSLLANQVTVGTATVSGTTTFANGGSAVDGQVTTFTVVVPEPATVALAVIGVALAGYAVRRRRR